MVSFLKPRAQTLNPCPDPTHINPHLMLFDIDIQIFLFRNQYIVGFCFELCIYLVEIVITKAAGCEFLVPTVI